MALVTAGTAACAKCAYFDQHAQGGDAQGGETLGLCRYNPPLGQASGDQAGVWPKVAADDWCGHFEPATAA